MPGGKQGRLVDIENFSTPFDVGGNDGNLPVETTRPFECRIEDVRTVGSRHNDDIVRRTEAIHFHEQGVKGLTTLVVAIGRRRFPGSADRIDLIDEHNTGRIFLGFAKQVADTLGADTNEHFHEIGAAEAVKRHPCLTGNSPGQQRLACARRSLQ